MDDPIANSLGIDPMPQSQSKPIDGEIVEASSPQVPSTNITPIDEASAVKADELERDYNYARGNMYDVIEKGVDAMQEMLDIAKQDQNARSFEVVSTIMKQVVEANKDLVEVSKQKNAPKDEEKAAARPDRVTNNNLFVGSTADLQKMLRDAQEDE